MRPVLEPGLAPLPEAEVEKMLKEHIPYRLRLLVDAAARLPARCDADNQAFEAGTVSGRVLLGFLGIRFEENTGQLREDRTHRTNKEGLTDDVKVRDVSGQFADLAALSSEDAATLCRFINGAHKACAHFTIGSDHELDASTYRQSVPIIVRLLRGCLPRKQGNP